jgi:RNA polymerase sigma-70 factor (ECF subfamily)
MNPVLDEAAQEEAAWMVEFMETRRREPYERLFRRYRTRMVAYAMKYVRSQDRAEELAQDVFVRVYTSKQYRPDAPFRAWLYRVATNVCLNEVRKAEYKVTREDGVGDRLPGGPDPDAELMGAELARRLRRTLEQLPDKQRAAFVMARFEGLSHQEIGGALGTSVSAVKSLIHRALEALRRELREGAELEEVAP